MLFSRSVMLFVTPWTAACQASLSITSSQSLLKLMSIELMMPTKHVILCHPLLLLSSVFLWTADSLAESNLQSRGPWSLWLACKD